MTERSGNSNGFAARGGWWVVAQMPLLLLAYLIPVWTGRTLPLDRLDGVGAVGLALIVAGIVQSAAGLFTLGVGLTPYPRPLDNGVLRTRGAYALVRHPIYTGILFVAAGWSLHYHSLAGLGFDLALFVFFDRKSAHEERWLVRKYPEYEDYRRRVKKLIPWIY